MKNFRLGVLFIASVFSVSVSAITPNAPTINAKGHLLIDASTGKVLSEDNSETQLAPASLTKMMTSYIIGMEIKKGNISLEDQVTISEKAWAKNFPDSSKMFIEVGKQVSVADLNRGIIIQSGNDACVAMAEHIAGSESAFADLMNAYATELGMHGSNFENSHGLPGANHFTTPVDMAILAKALINDVPEEYAVYSEKSFTFNGIKQYNRNSLLWDKSMNVDGIKTGHTQEAGYSLVSSATKGGMRLISVVMGASSERARKTESKKLLNYGFRFFETITPYKAGKKFADQKIWLGDKKTVRLGISQDTPITIPRGKRKALQANLELDKALEAPLKKGTVVGKVYLQLEGEDIASYPLVALESVAEGGFFSRMVDKVKMSFAE
ncbi:D-alanyl-D-alanine carboxypeptidase [Saccharobesus litoralis]|uniref:serine-type D-Ala-D-Ala carboxypeptidase n=1 Tax=Saccharobesus litoralis TaxID=2172099 RepID=A0A2S0VVZ8_9ALTE|nr:serine hydrolase [Saccharobesus litoralis]AWB68280.1 D-alanyl-D-alanine carboxypeptidase [Saccharobesus litoralis]